MHDRFPVIHHHSAERRERLCHHAHGHRTVLLLMRGSFEQDSGSQMRRCSAGTARLASAGAIHDLRFGGEGGECVVIEVPEAHPVAGHPAWALGTLQFLSGAEDLIRDLSRAAGADARSFAVEDRLYRLLALAERRSGAPLWLDHAIALLSTDERLPTAVVARAVGLHPVYFARAFRCATGRSPAEFHLAARLDRARHMIGDGLPLAAVATATGFADQSHFGRWFLRRYGLTPHTYRRRLRTF